MSRYRLPRSIRKFLRREKAHIRREIFDVDEAGKRVTHIMEKFHQRAQRDKLKSVNAPEKSKLSHE